MSVRDHSCRDVAEVIVSSFTAHIPHTPKLDTSVAPSKKVSGRP